ncbi:SCP2 sterol-binding domain-containing protein [Streptomyces polyrhachis]|uniref:SCP2 sterol-binding domain-containing protein n=1 Tax=Streptomyces polyrhachis TaxID=1282885 RepID=A0ABW2GHD2_9ACTN
MPDANGLGEMDFESISPEDYAKLVKSLSIKEIREIAADAPLRATIIAAIFARMGRQFRPESAAGLKAVVRWKITGEGEADELVYETKFDSGTVAVSEGRTDVEPRTTLTMDDLIFLKLTSGNSNPVTLFLTRKLKLAGDVGFAAGLTRYFDIPKA